MMAQSLDWVLAECVRIKVTKFCLVQLVYPALHLRTLGEGSDENSDNVRRNDLYNGHDLPPVVNLTLTQLCHAFCDPFHTP